MEISLNALGGFNMMPKEEFADQMCGAWDDYPVEMPTDPREFVDALFERLESEDGAPESVAARWIKKRDEALINAHVEAKTKELREALKPFADYADRIALCDASRDFPDACPITIAPEKLRTNCLTVGDLRRAKAALQGKEEGENT